MARQPIKFNSTLTLSTADLTANALSSSSIKFLSKARIRRARSKRTHERLHSVSPLRFDRFKQFVRFLFYVHLYVSLSIITCNESNSNNNEYDLINTNNALKFGDRLSPRMRSYSNNSSVSEHSNKDNNSSLNNNYNSVNYKTFSNNKYAENHNSNSNIDNIDRQKSHVINNNHNNNNNNHNNNSSNNNINIHNNNNSDYLDIKVLGDDSNDLTFNDNEINRNDFIATDAEYANNDYFTIMHNKHHDLYSNVINNGKNFTTTSPIIDQGSDVSSGVKTSSQAQAHRLEMSTEFFVVPPTQLSSIYSTKSSASISTQRPRGVVLATKNLLKNSNHTNLNSNLNALPNNKTVYATSVNRSGLRKEPWVVPVLVLSCLSMIMMASFEIFVLCKTRRTSPNRRHLFLGQMLLLGLFSCSGLSALLTAKPTTLSCGTIRFGAGVSFAIVFASLLVKCIFLISLNGGVYLPAPYQGLLLLFAVLIQVTIGIQWLITSPPGINYISASDAPLTSRQYLVWTAEDLNALKFTIQLCKTSFSDLLLSLVYVGCLIIFVTILAIKSRGIRDNYREATYIGLAIGGTIPIWLGWTLCGLAVNERHRDACLAFGLVATSSVVFLVMFMPKGRQLAAMGREDLYVEDREERFSASSRAGSGYSPSFFHFKPIKYGVMGQKSNQIVNNSTNSKHQQAVATLGGDQFALVAVPPPYYARMYHLSAQHLTYPLCYYPTLSPQPPPHYAGLFMQPNDDANVYTTLEQTMSSNPNVYFQRSQVHPGMIY